MARTPRWDALDILLVTGNGCLWVIGVLLFLGLDGTPARPVGEVLTIIAATTTVLLTLRAWQLRMHRAFVHGYHAGWHEKADRECLGGMDCDVLDFAEVQARKLARLN